MFYLALGATGTSLPYSLHRITSPVTSMLAPLVVLPILYLRVCTIFLKSRTDERRVFTCRARIRPGPLLQSRGKSWLISAACSQRARPLIYSPAFPVGSGSAEA